MMTTIERHGPHTTLINVFTVSPDRANELVTLLDQATEQVMRHLPGFVSANIHVSLDGTRVVNYAQWESSEAYQAMLANPAAREHMGGAAGIAEGFDPHFYRVESVVEAVRSSS
jgi:quinol monooxygenase YgiN